MDFGNLIFALGLLVVCLFILKYAFSTPGPKSSELQNPEDTNSNRAKEKSANNENVFECTVCKKAVVIPSPIYKNKIYLCRNCGTEFWVDGPRYGLNLKKLTINEYTPSSVRIKRLELRLEDYYRRKWIFDTGKLVNASELEVLERAISQDRDELWVEFKTNYKSEKAAKEKFDTIINEIKNSSKLPPRPLV